ncbi:SRPBCC family protein [Flavobacterium sp.]|uniref:SRPBCC family protein n=1 Tax=Flavobacterium sp. TaxID=239 RepID=UPI002B91EC54|nr:SRPBCC family protein [Flavobacterium sp.]HSD05861.1 SRPBCC family protein [Flavobacterium sp.]
MNSNNQLTNTMATNISKITINASTQKVWNTLTKPELVKLWQFGSDLQTNWEIGSKILFTTEWNGQIFKQWGTVLEIKPNELIKYNLFAPRPDLEDKPENYFIMSYVLTNDNGKTNLEIIQEDNRPNAVQDDEQGEENPILKSLKEVAETN